MRAASGCLFLIATCRGVRPRASRAATHACTSLPTATSARTASTRPCRTATCSAALPAPSRAHVGAASLQYTHNGRVPAAGSQVQRCAAACVARLHAGAVGGGLAHAIRIAARRSSQQRLLATALVTARAVVVIVVVLACCAHGVCAHGVCADGVCADGACADGICANGSCAALGAHVSCAAARN